MNHDAIVVGSGPSGVSVALPMLEAGMRVLLLDGGKVRDTSVPGGAYHDIRRRDADQWRAFLGSRLEGLRPAGPPSPKFDAPGSRFAFEDLSRTPEFGARGFTAMGSLARGGLSNIWGAGVSLYDERDLDAFPLTLDELSASYERVVRRIGVVGFGDDDLASTLDARMPSMPPMRLSENAARLLRRYERRRDRVRATGIRIGLPRTAVLTEPRGDRGGCAFCDMCVWGCREGAIYTAAHDVPALEAHAGFSYRPGALVSRIERSDGGYRITLRSGDALQARIVALAAGGLVTTRLVLEMQRRYDERVPVVGVPGVGFAVCLPERIGAAVSTREFSMGQLSFVAEGDPDRPGDDGHGTLFPATGVPASMFVERMPLSKPAAVRLTRYLQPALLVGNCFLPGHYGRNTAKLERDGRLVVEGGAAEDLAGRLRKLERQLGRAFRRLGAFVVPRSFSPIGPGEAIRYSGMLPMRAEPGPGELDPSGQLHGCPDLHVVDLASFPAMPAKHHTLTMMANADRVGRIIAERWRAGRAGAP